MLDLKKIEKSWTLFLDRDGVINHEKHNDYVHNWDQFRFYDGVKEAIRIFSEKFNRIIVVTNQKGVGKGFTKLEDLLIIHKNMIAEIEKAGGKIDQVYFCSDLDDNSPNRKPNPGMGKKAIKDFPEINPSKSIMIGNTLSDMGFGRNLGTQTVFLTTTRPDVDVTDPRIDMSAASLIEFAHKL